MSDADELMRVTAGDVLSFVNEAFRNVGPDMELGLQDLDDIRAAMQSAFNRIRARAAQVQQ